MSRAIHRLLAELHHHLVCGCNRVGSTPSLLQCSYLRLVKGYPHNDCEIIRILVEGIRPPEVGSLPSSV